MGFRFRRSIKLFPGVRINLSKSGVSTSVGTKGAWFTIGPRGTRTTVGIPGTGISYTEQHRIGAPRTDDGQPATPTRAGGSVLAWLVIVALVAVAFAVFA